MRKTNKSLSAILAGSALLLTAGIACAQSVVNLTAARQRLVAPDGNIIPMWGWLCGNPAGHVGVGGAATLPDPLVATNGLWFNGTPYLGPDAVVRSRGPTPLPPGGALQNPLPESGISFMWHSHNEREITTNDVFPGGMLMMMLVDPPVWYIDETL